MSLPGELVAQRVARVLRRRETAAVGEERRDLATLCVDLLDSLDGV